MKMFVLVGFVLFVVASATTTVNINVTTNGNHNVTSSNSNVLLQNRTTTESVLVNNNSISGNHSTSGSRVSRVTSKSTMILDVNFTTLLNSTVLTQTSTPLVETTSQSDEKSVDEDSTEDSVSAKTIAITTVLFLVVLIIVLVVLVKHNRCCHAIWASIRNWIVKNVSRILPESARIWIANNLTKKSGTTTQTQDEMIYSKVATNESIEV
ncbi:hypothetical protein [Carp edema virus]|nr:hypothetical protein [Carp edema virus]